MRYRTKPSIAIVTRANGEVMKVNVILVYDSKLDTFEAVPTEGALKGASIAVIQSELKKVRDQGEASDEFPRVR